MVATDLKHCDDVFVARAFVEERVVAACIVHFVRSCLDRICYCYHLQG